MVGFCVPRARKTVRSTRNLGPSPMLVLSTLVAFLPLWGSAGSRPRDRKLGVEFAALLIAASGSFELIFYYLGSSACHSLFFLLSVTSHLPTWLWLRFLTLKGYIRETRQPWEQGRKCGMTRATRNLSLNSNRSKVTVSSLEWEDFERLLFLLSALSLSA